MATPPRAGPSAAGALLLAWLGATLLPLLLGGVGGPRGVVLVLHAAVLAGVAALEARRHRPGRAAAERVLADWHLLLLFPALYSELPWLMAGLGAGYHDAAVAALEARIFGGQPAFEWAGAWPSRALSETLHAAYLAYYPVIYVPPLLLWLRGPSRAGASGAEADARDAFHHTVAALGLSMLACYAVFVVWPVQGPRYLGAPGGIPSGPVRGLVLAILESGSSRGAAFPSSHVSVAVTQTLLALRYRPRVGGALGVITLLLAAGAVYGGFHYAVDALAGAAVGAAAAAASGPLHRRLAGRTAPRAGGFTSSEDGV